MIVMAFFIAQYFSHSWQINALEPQQEQPMQALRQNVERQLAKHNDVERVLRRMGNRGRYHLMAINSNSQEISVGFPMPLLHQPERFLKFKNAQAPVLIRTRNMEFSGPFSVSANDQEYQLFIGRLLRRSQQPVFAFSVVFAVFLVSGTIACVAIARTIAKPIKDLSKLSNDFALGIKHEAKPEITDAFKKRKDELGQLHNDIYDMASKLATSLSQQKALMANISHELRTPLTRLQLALAMLQPSGDEQNLYAKRIEKDINVMDTLIGQALQLAKANDENNAQWQPLVPTLLSEVLTPLLDDLSFEANASAIELRINNNVDEGLVLPLAHASFVSAVENVTRNAIKFSQQQVEITLTVRTETASQSLLCITVEDDGEGLSDEQRSHIFEPFYRAASGKLYQGTGLGLAIAKAGVEMHNGQIDAYPCELGGLTISMLFPI